MSKLTAAERRRLSPKSFAGPDRSFPIEDKSHAEAAIRMAPRAEKAGHISKSQESHIVREARAKLHQRLGVLPRKHSARGR
ncbi:MAG: hypothetical protein KGI82_00920 [Betaproteobacteria bacterium]|nr:hypothetical protein [Betaproteobacteria bacterium]